MANFCVGGDAATGKLVGVRAAEHYADAAAALPNPTLADLESAVKFSWLLDEARARRVAELRTAALTTYTGSLGTSSSSAPARKRAGGKLPDAAPGPKKMQTEMEAALAMFKGI